MDNDSQPHSSQAKESDPSPHFWPHTPLPQNEAEPTDAIFHVRANPPFLVHKQEREFSPHPTTSPGDTHVA